MSPEANDRQGFICLHCGKPIVVPASPVKATSHLIAAGGAIARERQLTVALVWCGSCGKEAPYRVTDMTSFGWSDVAESKPALAPLPPRLARAANG